MLYKVNNTGCLEDLSQRLHHSVIITSTESSDSLLRLPDEVIIEILLFYRDISSEDLFQDQDEGPGDPDSWWWFAPTAICHRLRDVVLATPLYWSLIDDAMFLRPRAVHTTLRLSHKTPLDIYVYVPIPFIDYPALPSVDIRYERGLKSFKMIAKEFYRIRTLKLAVPWDTLLTVVPMEPESNKFTALETLKILYFDDDSPYEGDDDDLVLSSLFSRTTASLRRCWFAAMFIDWGILSQISQSLTSLFINMGYFSSCEALLDVLERLPLLEELSFGPHRFEILQDGSLEHREPIVMGNLKSLSLQYTSVPDQKLLSFMPFVLFPPGVQVSISMSVEVPQLATYSPMFIPIRRLLLHGERYRNESIRATIEVTDGYDGASDFGVTIGTVKEAKGGDPAHHKYLTSDVSFRDRGPLVDQFITELIEVVVSEVYDVLDELSFGQLKCNTVGRLESLGPTFARTLIKAENIRLLQMEKGYFNYLLPALSPMDDGTIPVPRLCKLKLMGGGSGATVLDANVLYNCLTARLGRGYKLEELELESCKLRHQSPDIYSLLGDAVGKLVMSASVVDSASVFPFGHRLQLGPLAHALQLLQRELS